MKTIQQHKDELAMKYLAEKLFLSDIKDLPKDDELRTFVCSLGPKPAFWYAIEVDKSPRDDTRNSCLPSAYFSLRYAESVDKSYREDTYQSACKDPKYKRWYEEGVPNFHKDLLTTP